MSSYGSHIVLKKASPQSFHHITFFQQSRREIEAWREMYFVQGQTRGFRKMEERTSSTLILPAVKAVCVNAESADVAYGLKHGLSSSASVSHLFKCV